MAVTAAVTLAVVGSLTWVVSSTYGSSPGVGSARGLPTGDPCAVVEDATIARMDGEVSSWSTGVYSNGCSWSVSLAGEEDVRLTFTRSVSMSDADASLVEERETDPDLARNAEELYSSSVERAAEVGYEADGVDIVDTQERPLGFGDESTLVVTDIDFGSSGDSYSQRATLVVREGDVVSQMSFNLVPSADAIDLNEAEDLLADVAADAFG